MTSDSSDPRINQILQLVTQITGKTNQADLDRIVEDLTALVEQRSHLNNILQSISDSLMITALDGNISMVNGAACQLLGYHENELLGQHIEDLFVKPFKNDDCENQHVVAKDGHHIPVSCSKSPLRNNHGHVKGFIYVAQDSSEFKKAEVALSQSETRYRALIESQIDLISCYRPDTTLTFVNDAYCRFYGKTRDELMGQSYLTMVAPEFREVTRQEAERMVETPGPISGEYLNYAANGEARWIQWVVQGIADERGQIIELQGVGRDVTQLKEIEAALRESKFFLQKSQSVARIGSYYLDIPTGNWVSSPMLDEIFGIDYNFPKNVEGWIGLIHPDEKEEMFQHLSEYVIAQRNRFDKEYRIVRYTDQQERWVYGLGELEFDEHGNPLKMIGTVQDITERKQMLEALRQSEEYAREFQEKLKALHEVNLELSAVLSVESLCEKAIQLGCSALGFDRMDLLLFEDETYISRFGIESTGELRVKRDISYVPQEVRMTLSGLLKSRESVFVSKDANLHDFENTVGRGWNVVTGIWDGNTSIGWLAADNLFNQKPLIPYQIEVLRLYGLTLGDRISRKRAETEIRRLNEELEQRVMERTKELEDTNEEVRHFAYIVSHDLRAPLVNLKGFASELRSSMSVVTDVCDEVLPLIDPAKQNKLRLALEEDIPEALRFIESSVSNMDSFTKAILKLSRLGRLRLELVEVDVRTLVGKTLHALAYQINNRGVTVTIGNLPTVTADFVSMEQIFGNILTNAISYLDPNRPGEIDISAEQQADETIFCIRDNGRGIAAEDMDKVFAPFRRAGNQDVPGEGMGLAYVQTLIRRHGGRIWCESEAGIGTRFIFTFPNNLQNNTVELD